MGIVTNGAEPNGPDVGVQKVQVQLGGLVCATHGPKLQESLPSSHAVDSALNSMSANAPVVLAAPRLQWRHLKICPAASRRRLQVAGILQLRLSLQLFWQHVHGPRPSWHHRPGFQARRSSTLTLEAEAAVPSLALATGPVQGPSDIASDSNAPHLLRHPASALRGRSKLCLQRRWHLQWPLWEPSLPPWRADGDRQPTPGLRWWHVAPQWRSGTPGCYQTATSSNHDPGAPSQQLGIAVGML